MYAGTTRTCVFNMCAWCRHTRGPFERVPDGGGRGEGRGVVVSLVFFIGKTNVFFGVKFNEHLNRTLCSSLIDSSAHQKFPTLGYHVLQRFTERNRWILPISSLRIPRTRTPRQQHTALHHTTQPYNRVHALVFVHVFFIKCMCT